MRNRLKNKYIIYKTKRGPRMLKTNSAQICLLNSSLEEFNKYIYRKAVGRELWRRNVLNTIISRMTAGNVQDGRV